MCSFFSLSEVVTVVFDGPRAEGFPLDKSSFELSDQRGL